MVIAYKYLNGMINSVTNKIFSKGIENIISETTENQHSIENLEVDII